jgi:cyclophilin family peptidyl-prolyl cis-trans isomerase
MKRLWATLTIAGLALTGCDHHDSTEAANAPPAAADSAYTGLAQKSPRALPVTSAPSATPSVPPSAPPPSVAVNPPTPVVEPPPAPAAPEPTKDASEMAAQAAAPGVTAPADSADAIPTTPPPSVATLPPRPMDEFEAKREVVVLETSLGHIVIELDDIAAPRTCGNFRKLVSNGFYNHTVFHRVIPSFMIQGGDPNSKSEDRRSYGLGDPGYTLPAEIKLKHTAGAVAMARLPDAANPERESNGSQFYICVEACPSLDDQYTVFGHVIRGMDTVAKISKQPRDKSDDPLDRIEMRATLETKQQALAENPN